MTYKIFISLCVLAVSYLGYGQYTFSKRHAFEFNTFTNSVHCLQESYIISSACYDTIGGLHIDHNIAWIDNFDNLQYQNQYGTSDRDLYPLEGYAFCKRTIHRAFVFKSRGDSIRESVGGEVRMGLGLKVDTAHYNYNPVQLTIPN